MTDNLENPTSSVEANFKVFYGLTGDALQKLGVGEGSLRKCSGEALTVKVFTREMLLQDSSSKQEMYDLIAKGLLGGVDENGQVHFHENIARLLDDNQLFALTDSTDSSSTINAKVVSISEESYSIVDLALEVLGSAQEVAEPEPQEKKHSQDAAPQTKLRAVNEAPTPHRALKSQYPAQNLSATVRRNLLEQMNEQLSTQREKNREQRLEEKRAQKKHEQKVRLKKEIAEERTDNEIINIEQLKEQSGSATDLPSERPKHRQLGTR